MKIDSCLCTICGEMQLQKFATFNKSTLSKCAACGTIVNVSFLYEISNHRVDVDMPMELLFEQYESMYRLYREKSYLRVIASLQHSGNQPGKILDIGCANGWFLKIAIANGIDGYGVDLSPTAINQASRYIPVSNLHVGSFGPDVFQDMNFDAISLFDVLEHIYDPDDIFFCLTERLKPGGWLIIRIPVVDSLTQQLSIFLFRITRGGYFKPLALLYRYHVYGFTSHSIKLLLQKYGFKIYKTWRENSLDPGWLNKKTWVTSKIEKNLALTLIQFQNIIGWKDELLIIARKT